MNTTKQISAGAIKIGDSVRIGENRAGVVVDIKPTTGRPVPAWMFTLSDGSRSVLDVNDVVALDVVISPTCKDCRFWGISYERSCDRITDADETALAYIEASASDDTGLQARMFTSAAFGCVLFEPKPVLTYTQVGDFYEFYDEAAPIVARIIGLTITSRRSANGVTRLMVGFPYHRFDEWAQRLREAGYTVAPAATEQIEKSVDKFER